MEEKVYIENKNENFLDLKELEIVPPEGYEIDIRLSTLNRIVFKPIKPKKWIDENHDKLEGYYIKNDGTLLHTKNGCYWGTYNINDKLLYPSKEDALNYIKIKALSLLKTYIKYDGRFGGEITREEWCDALIPKYCLYKGLCDKICVSAMYESFESYNELAFHNIEQAELFIEENIDLIKLYFGIVTIEEYL